MREEKSSRRLYLKTIRQLEGTGEKVRNVDIARALGYSKPSVTIAVQKLVSDGMAEADRTNGIRLTERGRAAAEGLVTRYNVLRDFLLSLGVEKCTAEENARRMDRVITDDLLDVLAELSEQAQKAGGAS